MPCSDCVYWREPYDIVPRCAAPLPTWAIKEFESWDGFGLLLDSNQDGCSLFQPTEEAQSLALACGDDLSRPVHREVGSARAAKVARIPAMPIDEHDETVVEGLMRRAEADQ